MDQKDKSKRDNIYEALNQPLRSWQKVLSEILSSFDCTTGTIHFLEPDTTQLKLEVHQGIPEFLIPKLSEIPIGKGMAGIQRNVANRLKCVTYKQTIREWLDLPQMKLR